MQYLFLRKMPSATAALLPCPIPYHFNLRYFHHHQHRHPLKRKVTTFSLGSSDKQIPIKKPSASNLSQTHSCIKGKENLNRIRYNYNHNQNHKHSLFLQFFPSIDPRSTDKQNSEDKIQKQQQGGERDEFKVEKTEGLCANMWWANVKAALGQRINLEGILCSTTVIVKDPKLALPHISVPDIRYIDWTELHRKGFKGVVFDKDNTLTAPYTLTPWPSLGSSLERCKAVFGPDIAVFSNSAGLQEYDHDGSKARALEGAIGIKVIRHRLKKPAGAAEEVEKHFGCESSKIIMVGDRPFTDIVYGNRNAFLTILTEPLSLAQEPFIVQQVRKLENSFVNYWSRRGLDPPRHKLLPDPTVCVKEPPSP